MNTVCIYIVISYEDNYHLLSMASLVWLRLVYRTCMDSLGGGFTSGLFRYCYIVETDDL